MRADEIGARRSRSIGLRSCATGVPLTEIETIGKRIKRERLELSMTQKDLAQAVEVGVPHISKVEAGRENPSDELLERLAEVFGLEFDELLLAARRVPDDLLDELASNPLEALEFLRTWKTDR